MKSKQSQFEFSEIHDIRDDTKFKMENNLTCILCNISHVVYITRKYLLTIFISKVAMIRESLLDFILTEKVNYFALFFIFYLPELSIFVIYRNFGWTSNYKCFPFKEYGRNINLYSKKRRGILISIYM